MASNKVLDKKDITKLAFMSMFLQASFNYERMQAGGFLCSQLPAWLTHGFEVAGGILPAVGFAMLLRVMLKFEFVPIY